jgi:hypothetical protein
MIIVRLAACTSIESAHFGPSTAVERAIMRYYEQNASEGGCFPPALIGKRTYGPSRTLPAMAGAYKIRAWRQAGARGILL